MKIGNVKIWKCKSCGKIFNTVQGLSVHLGKRQRKIEKNMSENRLCVKSPENALLYTHFADFLHRNE